jgi:succinate-semialdehyde dehydrogenase/glutarate-semialdehyde dehydrogenase
LRSASEGYSARTDAPLPSRGLALRRSSSHLARLAAGRFLRTSLELGGHAPVIVFSDADPERVAEVALAKKTLSSGQNCISPTRFLVEARVYDRFVARATELLLAVRVGDPLDPATGMGPLSNARRLAALETLVPSTVAAGARLAAGGQVLERVASG